MNKLLLIASSVLGRESESRRMADEFVAAWREALSDTKLIERDLNGDTIPHLTSDALTAIATPKERRTHTQQLHADFSDRLIEEVEEADTIVLAVPIYNFALPSTVKAWFDHITREGRSFRRTANGAEGLFRNKKVFVFESRDRFSWNAEAASAREFQEPYLRFMFGFLGFDDVTFVRAEGLPVTAKETPCPQLETRQMVSQKVPAAIAA